MFWEYALAPMIAISFGITSPNLVAAISEQASPSQQGEILGINQSMQSLGASLPPIIGGYLTAMNFLYPIIASSIIIFIAWLVLVLLVSPKGK